MSNNKAISAVTPETFINNNIDSLNKVQSNILSNMNSNKMSDVTKDVVNTTSNSNDTFFYFIIIFLLLTILGVNLFLLLGEVTDETIKNAGPFMRFVYSVFGYPVGEIIKTTSDVAGDGVKTGVDITTGTISNTIDTINEIVQPEDIYNIKGNIEKDENTIKNLNNKQGKKYCYVGASNGVNTCATISNSDKCLSGHIFDDLSSCMKK
jgi:hypothetical protein